MTTPIQKAAVELTKQLTDAGAIIDGGWLGFKMACVTPDASEAQLSEMRTAFFAGAQHLYGSIMSILDPGSEPTDRDMDRMTLIHNELETFRKDLQARIATNRGQQ